MTSATSPPTPATISRTPATPTGSSWKCFASDILEDVSLNQWLRRTPAEIVQAHLGFDKASLEQIPVGTRRPFFGPGTRRAHHPPLTPRRQKLNHGRQPLARQ